MALMKGKVRQGTAVERVSEGNEQFARLLSDGALITVDWKQAMVQEGRAFACNVGDWDSAGTGGGQGDTIDLDQPEFVLSIPDGVSVWPKRIRVDAEVPALAGDLDESEIIISCDLDEMINPGTPGTSTAGVVHNLNSDHSRTTMCNAQTLFSVNTGSATADLILAHAVQINDLLTHGTFVNSYDFAIRALTVEYEPDAPPRINGPAKLMIHWGGTVAVLAHATVEWFELPEGA